jgi:hypothetical protein
MGSRNEYWFYAQQCSDAAARAIDEGHRQFMLDMAETLRRLASGDMRALRRSRQSPYKADADSGDESCIKGEDQHRL